MFRLYDNFDDEALIADGPYNAKIANAQEPYLPSKDQRRSLKIMRIRSTSENKKEKKGRRSRRKNDRVYVIFKSMLYF